MTLLSDEHVTAALRELGNWTRRGEALERTFTCRSYADAMAAVVRLGFAAEAADHHPDVTWSYLTVTLRFTTHSEGGITTRDLAGATSAERAFAPFV